MSELETQIENRRRKRMAQEERGVDPFPRRYEYDLEPAAVHERHGEATAEELEEKSLTLQVPGRIRALRKHGKTAFLDLHDGEAKLQVMVRTKVLDEDLLAVLENLDLGDYLGVSGTLMRTRTGELTLAATGLTLLANFARM